MKPWDRQDKETPPAWAAFQAYRDLGPGRTIAKAWEACGRHAASLRLGEEWSSKHDWVARAAAWDAHIDQAVQAKLKAQAVERRKRQANLGKAMQGVAGQALQQISEDLAAKRRTLKGHEVAHLAKVGFDIEAVAEGDPNEIHGGGLEVRVVNVDSLPDPRQKAPPPGDGGSKP